MGWGLRSRKERSRIGRRRAGLLYFLLIHVVDVAPDVLVISEVLLEPTISHNSAFLGFDIFYLSVRV